MTQRACSVSIDLDPLGCYYRIHALGDDAPARLRQVILRRALPRFAEIFRRRNLRATLFVVGQDLAGGAPSSWARALLKELAAEGHELANHSDTHRYDMARLDGDAATEEIERAHQRLGELTGHAPVGFRAPGYDLSPAMVDALDARSYLYDSSVYPAPLYWTVKAAVMGALAVGGRRTGAVVTDPRLLAAPLEPYRPDTRAPWRRGQAGIVELPISVTRGLRVPVIGTSVLLAPTWLRARLLESMRARPFFNFELHGIDLIDADEDGIPAELVARQPDLRSPLVAKRRALEATLDRLAPDFRFATLREVATEVQREGHA